MKTFLHRTPDNMVLYDAHEDGKEVVGYLQNIEHVVELTKDLAKTDDHWKEGMKKSWVHAAIVPSVEIVRMLKEDGVNFYAKEDAKRVLQLLDTKYSYLKTVNKKLGSR